MKSISTQEQGEVLRREHTEAAKTDRPGKAVRRSRSVKILLFVILSTVLFLYSAMISPARFGDYGDDGIYVSAAKALATGQGYRMISLPQEKAQTQVPPFYPILLSLIWRLNPRFPENIPWMMTLSLIATLALLTLTYRYLTKFEYTTHWPAIIVVALAGINWRTMLHGTSVMSEMLYAALAVGGLYLIERYEDEQKSYRAGIVAGIVLGLAFLTRSSGITLLLAVAAYFVLRRRWRRALIPVGVASVFVVAWASWCFFNSSGAAGAEEIHYSSYLSGISHVYGYLQSVNEASGLSTLLRVVGTNLSILTIGSIPLSCLGLRYDLPPLILVSLVLITILLIVAAFVRQSRKRVRLLHLYVAIYLSVLLALPGTAYDRYIVPIAPFLTLLLVNELALPVSVYRTELASGKRLAGKIGASVILLVLLIGTIIVVYSNGSAIRTSLLSLSKIETRSSESAEAMNWIKSHTSPSDTLVCYRDAIYFLYTERKAVLSFPAIMLDTLPYRSRPLEPSEIRAEFFKIIDEYNAGYFIFDSDDFSDLSDLYQKTINEYIKENTQTLVPVFESKTKKTIIYRISRSA